MKKDKLLVIGAGIGQVPLIKKAQARGVYVIVVSKEGNYPAFDIADESWYLDIYDREAIAEKAAAEGVTAVISDQNDLVMPTVAYVATKLGLPGNMPEAVDAYCNKNHFRDNCDKLGIATPTHVKVNSADFDFSTFKVPLPWIIKPADSQSSIGVKKVNTVEEAKAALAEALQLSHTGTAILEEFFTGKEIVCEGYIDEGRYYNLSFADRNYFKLEKLLIPTQTIFPSRVDKKILDRIIINEQKIAEYNHPHFGMVHAEWLVNEETGEVRPVESAIRGGGVYISSHLIPLATGIDINEVLLDKALGIEVDVDELFKNKKNRASAYVCFYLPEGTIRAVRGMKELEELPFVHMVAISSVVVGTRTKKMTFKGQRLGPILVSGENRDDLENNIATVQKTLQVDVEGNDGVIRGICWE